MEIGEEGREGRETGVQNGGGKKMNAKQKCGRISDRVTQSDEHTARYRNTAHFEIWETVTQPGTFFILPAYTNTSTNAWAFVVKKRRSWLQFGENSKLEVKCRRICVKKALEAGGKKLPSWR